MKKVDCTPSWGFVTQVVLATLDANTNIKPKDRENIKGQLVDMSRVADAHVELMTKGGEKGGSNPCVSGELDVSPQSEDEYALQRYYEVDLDNCLMTHQMWIMELVKCMANPDEYKSTLRKKIKEYDEERLA
mgnify:CR=1 FL=1